MSFVPEGFQDLFSASSKAILFLATVMKDGTPQVTPVWFDTDGEYILINTNEGRIKDRNMKARPQVHMVVQDPNDAYRHVLIRGAVESFTTNGADEHINLLSLRYSNEPWTTRDDQKRIIFRIKPTRVTAH